MPNMIPLWNSLLSTLGAVSRLPFSTSLKYSATTTSRKAGTTGRFLWTTSHITNPTGKSTRTTESIAKKVVAIIVRLDQYVSYVGSMNDYASMDKSFSAARVPAASMDERQPKSSSEVVERPTNLVAV
ncbi:uncharacterized protein Z518_02474 [Rhinocladiella mackenziei CBS 650.93]|uniref:Uncharacterized protein n=1 Tax=Rhinocladiella mackenziei CBS 650.93 TaxID=1442369 RepID=A0A0D2JF35_9EURO|nr:uncharacterized protein Z518_02474 [Rhinocladiella mackenziei CBS 650.93]KIX07820.1 hypothetical protein Z518_02474 [Rhinocladiella mackenziei CBS 650.93]